MKTFEEIEEALNIITQEAHESGFALCAAVSPNEAAGRTGVFKCGRKLVVIGLAELIKSVEAKEILK